MSDELDETLVSWAGFGVSFLLFIASIWIIAKWSTLVGLMLMAVGFVVFVGVALDPASFLGGYRGTSPEKGDGDGA